MAATALWRVTLPLVCTVALLGCGGGAAAPSDGARDGRGQVVADGRQAYEASCAGCHGVDLEGTANGPALLDPIYAPDHHPDETFYAAVERGVQPHHGDFGPMPRLAVEDDDVRRIVAYIRSVQRAEGIAP